MLGGSAENDEFNQLVLLAGIDPKRGRLAARLVPLFAPDRKLVRPGHGGRCAAPRARRDRRAGRPVPRRPRPRDQQPQGARSSAEASSSTRRLSKVRAIDDDRILRRLRALVGAILRTNAFAPAADEALAFKINSALVPGLPAPVPWREIWVYSPARRGHPPARRPGRPRRPSLVRPARRFPHRDPRPDEGAAGQECGDRPDRRQGRLLSQASAAGGRGATPGWPRARQATASSSARCCRSPTISSTTRSCTPPRSSSTTATTPISSSPPTRAPRPSPTSPTASRSSAASGSATPSPAAAPTATTTRRWGSPRAARGFRSSATSWKWASTSRPTRSRVAGRRRHVGRRVRQRHAAVEARSSWSPRSTTATSSSIPTPIPALSWRERKRLFELPRSSWDDYDRKVLSKSGGIYPRDAEVDQPVESRARAARPRHARRPTRRRSSTRSSRARSTCCGSAASAPTSRRPTQSHAEVGDPANDAIRVDADRGPRARSSAKAPTSAITQAARIEFSESGGRINTDFIDNSAGRRLLRQGSEHQDPAQPRDARGPADAGQAQLAAGADDRRRSPTWCSRTTGCRRWRCRSPKAAAPPPCPARCGRSSCSKRPAGSTARSRGWRAARNCFAAARTGRGLTRPELAVVLSMSKMALQDAAEELELADDKLLEPELFAAFPKPMRKAHAAGDPPAPAAQRDHRHPGRQPPRQPPRAERRARHDRGGRRVARPGGRRLPRRRAPARPRRAVGADRERDAGRNRSASSCSQSPRPASARICRTSCARSAARPTSARSTNCSSRRSTRSRSRRPG